MCTLCHNVTDQDEAILLEGYNTLHRTSWQELIFLFFYTHTHARTHTRAHRCISGCRLQMNKNQKDMRGMKSMHHLTGKGSDTNKVQLYWANFSLKIWCRIRAVTSRKTQTPAPHAHTHKARTRAQKAIPHVWRLWPTCIHFLFVSATHWTISSEQ